MNKQAVGQVARDADINRKHITAHGAGDGADACFPADKVFRDDGCHLLTCLRHAFFDDTVVRAEYDDTSPVQTHLSIPSDTGDLYHRILKKPKASERLGDAVPPPFGKRPCLCGRRLDRCQKLFERQSTGPLS